MAYQRLLNRLGQTVFFLTVVLLITPLSVTADQYIVTNTDDSGAGSLRQAMIDAVAHAGPDTIVFNIPEGVPGHDPDVGIWVIKPSSALPILNSDSTVIDGSTQAAFIGGDSNDKGPEIVLDGASAGFTSGIVIRGSYNEVHDIVINNFSTSQITISGSYNRVTGCYLGTDFSGEAAAPSGDFGIFLELGSSHNTIGGQEEGDRNIISGVNYYGIEIAFSHYNSIVGNFIGLTRSGTDTLGNSYGIDLSNGSKHNVIGPGNVIAGNEYYGIFISQAGTDSNRVIGNLIGTDSSGTVTFKKQRNGICIFNKACHNIIGGTSPEERNIICGGIYTGINLSGDSTNWNQILGNYIGINRSGTDTLSNSVGISLSNGPSHNTIGPGNIISGNTWSGLDFRYSGTDSNVVIGNIIGLDPSGTIDMGNGGNGIEITDGPSYNIIGGVLPEERNIISGNGSNGIYIYSYDTPTDSNRIIGNYIGTDISGTSAIPNVTGILLYGDVKHTVIGGNDPDEGNLISGNLQIGIALYEDKCEENRIVNNKIGTDISGNVSLKNGNNGIDINSGASSNIIGPGNTIAFNGNTGVAVYGTGSVGNTITRNSIYSNGGRGINLVNGGNNELQPPVITNIGSVSGTAPPNSIVEIFSGNDDEGKIYEGFVSADGSGNFLWPGTPQGPMVTATTTDGLGNTSEFSAPMHMGTFVVTTTADTGEGSLRWAIENANLSAGSDSIIFNIPESDPGFNGTVWVISPESQLPYITDDSTIIDGSSQTTNQSNTNLDGPEIFLNGENLSSWYNGLSIRSSGNVICGMIVSGFNGSAIDIYGDDARGNRILGNFIGTNEAGTDTVCNSNGITIWNHASGNIIGGTSANDRNLISGNQSGISISHSDSNIIVGNVIGLNSQCNGIIKNTYGILISDSSSENRIGGGQLGERNIISGNTYGIYISGKGADHNIVKGNFVGTGADGITAFDNNYGIYIYYQAKGNIIGGMDDGEANVISGNDYNGVSISGEMADYNMVIGNLIGTDLTGMKAVANGYNGVLVSLQAKHNQIGPDNIVSGNNGSGIIVSGAGTDSNFVIGNWVGLDATGQDTIPNHKHGIRIEYKAKYNTIGGPSKDERNIVSGNGWSGITTLSDSTAYNIFQNNYCGTDTSGTMDLGNNYYGAHFGGLRNILIDNLFSGNRRGIMLAYSIGGNLISNNMIGVKADGVSPLPNTESGIQVENAHSDTIGPDNKIWYNGDYGIRLYGNGTKHITITRNSIAKNVKGGISLESGANRGIEAPVITGSSPLVGTAPPNTTVEIFSDSSNQGQVYEASVLADGSGNWSYGGALTGPKITATATDDSGNTSGFSNSLEVSVEKIETADALPERFFLMQNYPNPFNPETQIVFGVKEPCRVVLKIYNTLGQVVVTLIDWRYEPGQYKIDFNAAGLASGIYFYKIKMKDFTAVKKMIVLE